MDSVSEQGLDRKSVQEIIEDATNTERLFLSFDESLGSGMSWKMHAITML
jgi:hypothetical protein